MESIAGDLDVAFDQLRADADLAEAVDQIVSNCGEQATRAIFYSGRAQSEKAVLKLSRKSREV